MAGRSASFRAARAGLAPMTLLLGLAASGCSPDLSPNTYNSGAVQQANKAEQGVIVGVRKVDVRVSGATGAVVGGAAGGIAGSQIGNGSTSAFGALGGSLIGGLIGAGVEHAAGDTGAYEYIVRKTNKEMVSVTQKDDPPLAIGEHVLVIAGSQARIVPDYTVSLPTETPDATKQAPHDVPPVPPAAAGTPAATPPQGATAQGATAQGSTAGTTTTGTAAQSTPSDATAQVGAAAAPAPAAAPPAESGSGGSAAPPAAASDTATIPVPKAATTTAEQAATAAAAQAAATVAATQGAPTSLLPTKLTLPTQ